MQRYAQLIGKILKRLTWVQSHQLRTNETLTRRISLPISSQMENPYQNKPMYLNRKIAVNLFGSKGCEYMC